MIPTKANANDVVLSWLIVMQNENKLNWSLLTCVNTCTILKFEIPVVMKTKAKRKLCFFYLVYYFYEASFIIRIFSSFSFQKIFVYEHRLS